MVLGEVWRGGGRLDWGSEALGALWLGGGVGKLGFWVGGGGVRLGVGGLRPGPDPCVVGGV
ncbi:hypothetical protein [Sutcliffiella deserti]|uniref:hypothetical protein n=1 Tax=Sutcliffiella deserti TaxID=2875501 RepID=UPI001CBC5E9C|nr:hypothetical protein [Sutcliffiella deserti]